jgi:hypothetical protein
MQLNVQIFFQHYLPCDWSAWIIFNTIKESFGLLSSWVCRAAALAVVYANEVGKG